MTSEHRVMLDLVDRAMEGDLDGDDVTKLSTLISQSESDARYARQMFMLEAALRARAVCPNMANVVVQELKQRDQREQATTLAVVMSGVRGRPGFPVPRRSRTSPLVAIAWVVGAAVALAGTATVALHRFRTDSSAHSEAQNNGAQRTQIDSDRPRPKNAAVPIPSFEPNVALEPMNATTTVFEFDFEEGVLPLAFEQGHVINAPSDAGTRYVVQGTFNPWAPRRSSIIIGNAGVLFEYRRNLVLSFRYFWDGEGRGIRVQMFNIDQRQNYQWNHASPVKGVWNKVDVSLDDFYPVADRTSVLEGGDRLQNIFIIGGALMEQPLFVDDIALRISQ